MGFPQQQITNSNLQIHWIPFRLTKSAASFRVLHVLTDESATLSSEDLRHIKPHLLVVSTRFKQDENSSESQLRHEYFFTDGPLNLKNTAPTGQTPVRFLSPSGIHLSFHTAWPNLSPLLEKSDFPIFITPRWSDFSKAAQLYFSVMLLCGDNPSNQAPRSGAPLHLKDNRTSLFTNRGLASPNGNPEVVVLELF